MNLRVIYGSRAPEHLTDRDPRTDLSGGLHRITGRAVRRFAAARRAHAASEQATERAWFWRRVKLEVERSRRTERAFTVLSIREGDPSAHLELGALLHPHLRGTDAILAEPDGLLILLSETSGDDARRAVHRLARVSGDRIIASDVAAVAFPRDAITFGGLVEGLIGSDPGRRLSIAG
ncbi:MAG TPA: hypothetical protein VK917_09285 [Ilumatobacter sp.]|nr:hypothetical protein [Ilumatobacter sp.]